MTFTVPFYETQNQKLIFGAIFCYEILPKYTNILENKARLHLSPQIISQHRFCTKLKTAQPYFICRPTVLNFIHIGQEKWTVRNKLIYALQ